VLFPYQVFADGIITVDYCKEAKSIIFMKKHTMSQITMIYRQRNVLLLKKLIAWQQNSRKQAPLFLITAPVVG